MTPRPKHKSHDLTDGPGRAPARHLQGDAASDVGVLRDQLVTPSEVLHDPDELLRECQRFSVGVILG